MIRIAARQLRAQGLTWLGTLAACIVTAIAVSLALNLQESIGAIEGADFGSYAFPIVALTLVTGVIVTGSSVRLAVESIRRDIALLGLAGLAPWQASALFYIQATSIAALGALAGVVLAIPLSAPTVILVSTEVLLLNEPPPISVAANPNLVSLLVVGATIIATVGSARKVARVTPQVALRGEHGRGRQMTAFRWCMAAVGILLTLNAIVLLATGGWVFNLLDPPVSSAQAMINAATAATNGSLNLLISLVVLFAAVAPLLVAVTTRLWTGMLPTRAHASWLIARRNALAEPTRAAAAVTPLVIGIVIVAGVFSILTTVNMALDDKNVLPDSVPTEINTPSILTVVSAPLALALLAALLSIIIDARRRRDDLTLYRLSGATGPLISLASILEACIHAITAALLGLLFVGAVTAIAAASLSSGGLPAVPVLALPIAGIMATAGAVILAALLLLVPVGKPWVGTRALRRVE